MMYKRDESPFWWVKIKHKSKLIRQSTKTTDKNEAILFEDDLRRTLNTRKSPINTGTCYLYIIGLVDAPSPVKIGISKRPSSRLASLQSGHYEALVIYSTAKLANVKLAADIEAKVHEIFKTVHIRGEWFEVDAYAAEETILRLVGLCDAQKSPGNRKDCDHEECRGLDGCLFDECSACDGDGWILP